MPIILTHTTGTINNRFFIIIKEKDFERKKKHTAKWYQEEVAKELKLEDKDNPSNSHWIRKHRYLYKNYSESIAKVIMSVCKVG